MGSRRSGRLNAAGTARAAVIALCAWLCLAAAAAPPAAPTAPAATAPSGPTSPSPNPMPVPGPTATQKPAAAVLPEPCRELLIALPLPMGGQADPAPYLSAASCLRRQDSLAALKGGSGAFFPLERGIRSATGRSTRASDSLLRARMPDKKDWFMTHLERFRVRRDIVKAQDMAYLTEAKALPDPEIYRELAAVYLVVPDPYRTGLALLRQAELDSLQGGYLQYQLENLLHTHGSEVTAEVLIDSLTAGYPHRTARTAELMEVVSWSNRNYVAAYRNLLSMMALKPPSAPNVLERVNRFQSLGYFDYAAAILEKLSWRRLPVSSLTLARTLHLQIRHQLQDWPSIIAEGAGVAPPAVQPGAPTNGAVRYPPFNDEEIFIIAHAYLKLGRPEEALARAKRLEEKGEPPWGFRGRLLKAQAQLAMGRPKEAEQTLTALKRDPKRQEGTGPILFWQGCLALDQGRYAAAESLMVLASAYTGAEEAQRALEYRFFMLLDTGAARPHFFRGMPESPHAPAERAKSLDRVADQSGLWPFAQLEKAQIHLQNGDPDSAEAVFDLVSKRSPDRLAAFQAEAKAAFTVEKLPGGRQAALARYEDLLIKYQQGVIPEFSRGRIRALK
jgi:tetratricopeptide (TPR) repeat protein